MKIQHRYIKSEQKPYRDRVTEYEITTDIDKGEDEIIEYISDNFSVNINRRGKVEWTDGCCGFPFGLYSFYAIQKVDEGKYRLYIVDPYND